jgi:hypothetical protein
MFDTRKCLIQDLPEWLEIATKELTPLARERIQSEIEAHYAEGVAAHLGEGLSESDARRGVLADLGSPDEAADLSARLADVYFALPGCGFAILILDMVRVFKSGLAVVF